MATTWRRRLERASDAELRRVAEYARPRWRTITVRCVDPADPARVVGTRPLEAHAHATLADVRQLLGTFWPELPVAFAFVRHQGDAADERRVPMAEALDDNDDHHDDGALNKAQVKNDGPPAVLTVVATLPTRGDDARRPRRPPGSQGPRSPSAPDRSTADDGNDDDDDDDKTEDGGGDPAFTARGMLAGDLRADVAVVVRRRQRGLTLRLDHFTTPSGTPLSGLTPAAAGRLVLRVDAAALGAHVGMTAGTVRVLLAAPRQQQAALAHKLLRRLHLSRRPGAEGDEVHAAWTNAGPHDDDHPTALLLPAARRPRPMPVAPSPTSSSSSSRIDTATTVVAASAADIPAPTSGLRKSPSVPSLPSRPIRASSSSSRRPNAPSSPSAPMPRNASAQSLQPLAGDSAGAMEPPRDHDPERVVDPGAPATAPATTPPRKPPAPTGADGIGDSGVRTLRTCLELATRPLGPDLEAAAPSAASLSAPSGASASPGSLLVVHMAFVELQLREFVPTSLPAFVREARRALKEVYRSVSLAESVVKSTEVLWAGLGVGAWEVKTGLVLEHFRAAAAKRLEALQAELTQAHFPALEGGGAPPAMGPVPPRIEALIRALGVVAGQSPEAAPPRPIEAVAQDLGLHEHKAIKRRARIFAPTTATSAAPKGRRRVPLPRPELRRFAALVAAADLLAPFSPQEEAAYNVPVLRACVQHLQDLVAFNLCAFARRSAGNIEATSELLNALRAILKSHHTAANITANETPTAVPGLSAAFVEALTAAAAGPNVDHTSALAPESLKAIERWLHCREPVRWVKTASDCALIAASPRPSRLQWFIEPPAAPHDLEDERYVFVGEGDLALELAYLEYDDDDSDGSRLTSVEEATDVVRRAVARWWPGASAPGADVDAQVPTTPRRLAKAAMGVNFRHPQLLAAAPATVGERPATLDRLLATLLELRIVDGVTLGCALSEGRGLPSVVLLRVFAHETYAAQHATRLPMLLEALQQPGELQHRLLASGALPLVRLGVVREIKRREGVVTLDTVLTEGPSAAHVALRAALVAAGTSPMHLRNPRISHAVLELLLTRRVDGAYGEAFLRRVGATLIEMASRTTTTTTTTTGTADDDRGPSVGDILNQPFAFALPPPLAPGLHPPVDVFDVLWLIATRAEFPPAWRECARSVTAAHFTTAGILKDDRVWCYSLDLPPTVFGLQDDPGASLFDPRPVAGPLDAALVAYYKTIVDVVHRALEIRDASSASVPPTTKLLAAMRAQSASERHKVIKGLLARYFSVVHDTTNASTLGLSDKFVEVLVSAICDGILSPIGITAVQWLVSLARVCADDDAMAARATELGLVDRVLSACWDVEDPEIGERLLVALAAFQKHPAFRQQVVVALSRQFKPAEGDAAFMKAIIPGLHAPIRAARGKQPRRFNAYVSRHHADTFRGCQCGNAPADARVNVLEVVRATANTAVRTVVSIAYKHVVDQLCTGGPPRPQRLLTAATRMRKAAKIQRRVLRWLYIAKRSNCVLAGVRARCRGTECSCPVSFLAQIFNALEDASIEPTGDRNDSTFLQRVLECISLFVGDDDLCAQLHNDFRLDYTLLVLTSHGELRVRTLALRALAQLCWRCEAAFDFVSSRLRKAIWENRAFWQKADQRYCSWIEYVLRLAIEKNRVTMSGVGTGSSTGSLNIGGDNLATELSEEIDAIMTMLMILSYGSENNEIMLKVVLGLVRNIRTWKSCSQPFLQLRLLLIVQNTLILSNSLDGLHDFVSSILEEIEHLISTESSGDCTSKAIVLGILWTLCTWRSTRAHIADKHKTVLSRVLDFVDVDCTNRHFRSDELAMIMNALGLIATAVIDTTIFSFSETLLDRLGVMYDTVSASWSPNAHARKSYLAQSSRERSFPFCTVVTDWGRRLCRYALLPQVGSLSPNSSWEALGRLIGDQIFRLFTVICVSPNTTVPARTHALELYANCITQQVVRADSAADFALQTLSQVFRVVKENAVLSVVVTQRLLNVLSTLVHAFPRVFESTVSESDVKYELKRLRWTIEALWDLHILSDSARSVSQDLIPQLQELLHVAVSDEKLRIAILGLLVVMIRVNATSNSEDVVLRNAQQQSVLFRAIVDEVPLIMGILRSYAEGTRGSLIRPSKKWSPLTLIAGDAPSCSSSKSQELEVVARVRWPVDLLYHISESFFATKIPIESDAHHIITKILKDLDEVSLRKLQSPVSGRQELVAELAAILRVLTLRVPLPPHLVRSTFEILCTADVLMTYPRHLAEVVLSSLQVPNSINMLIMADFGAFAKILNLFDQTGIRADVLCKCLQIVKGLAMHLGESSLVKNLESCGVDVDKFCNILFRPIRRLLSVQSHGIDDWAAIAQAMSLFIVFLSWSSFRCHLSIFEASILQNASSVTTPAPSDGGFRPDDMLIIALQLLHFKFWLDDTPPQAVDVHAQILAASQHSADVVAACLAHKNHSRDGLSPQLSSIISKALVQECPHRELSIRKITGALDALIGVLAIAWSSAAPVRWASSPHRDAVEGIRRILSLCLSFLARCHEARHSAQLTNFVRDNYPNPVFTEPDAQTRLHLLRTYRLATCNPVIYRLIRLGKTSMWNLSGEHDQDHSFYRRLGDTFTACTESEWEVQFELSLFLAHQHYRLTFTADFKFAMESKQDAAVIRLADGKTYKTCIEKELYLRPTDSQGSLSYAVREFDIGRLNKSESSSESPTCLLDALICPLVLHWRGRLSSAEGEAATTDALILLTTVKHIFMDLVNEYDDRGVELQAITALTWTRISETVRSSFVWPQELESLYDLCGTWLRRTDCVDQWRELLEAIACRLGWGALVKFGDLSCETTMEFIARYAESIVSAVDSLGGILKGLTEVLCLNGEATCHSLAHQATSCLAALMNSHMPNVVALSNELIKVLDHPDPAPTHPSFVLAAGSSSRWRALFRFLTNEEESSVDAVLRILNTVAMADVEALVDRLLFDGGLAQLLDQMCHSRYHTRKNAFVLLRKLIEASRSGKRVAGALAKLMYHGPQPFYDGPLSPLRLSKDAHGEFESAVDASSGHTRRSDTDKVVDLFQRHPISIGLAIADLIELSLLMDFKRLSPGEPLVVECPSPHNPTLVLVVTGTVQVVNTTEAMSKGYVIFIGGDEATVGVRVTATSDVICMVSRPTLWNQSPRLARLLNRGIARWSGQREHGKLLSRSKPDQTEAPAVEALISVVLEGRGADVDLEEAAARILGLLADYLTSLIRSGVETFRCKWFVLTFFKSFQQPALPQSLRSVISKMLVSIVQTRHHAYLRLLLTLDRQDRNSILGLVLLGRALSSCLLDEQCSDDWRKIAHAMLEDSPRRWKTLMNAVSPGTRLRLVGKCLLAHEANADESPSFGVWDTLMLVSESRECTVQMVKSLQTTELSSLCHGILSLLQHETCVHVGLRLLFQFSRSETFVVHMWAVRESRELAPAVVVCLRTAFRFQVARNASHCVWRFLGHSLKTGHLQVESVSHLVAFAFKLPTHPEWSDPTEAVGEFIRALNGQLSRLEVPQPQTTARALLHHLCTNWVRHLEQRFVSITLDLPVTRHRIMSSISALRICYVNGISEVAMSTHVHGILQNLIVPKPFAKNRIERLVPMQASCALLGAYRAGKAGQDADVVEFFSSNEASWKQFLMVGRRVLVIELRRLHCLIVSSSGSSSLPNERYRSLIGHLLSWLLSVLCPRTRSQHQTCSTVYQIAARCISELLQRDEFAREYARHNGQSLLSDVFNAFLINGAEVAKAELMDTLCSCLSLTTVTIAKESTLSHWVATLHAITKNHTSNPLAMQTFARITLWLARATETSLLREMEIESMISIFAPALIPPLLPDDVAATHAESYVVFWITLIEILPQTLSDMLLTSILQSVVGWMIVTSSPFANHGHGSPRYNVLCQCFSFVVTLSDDPRYLAQLGYFLSSMIHLLHSIHGVLLNVDAQDYDFCVVLFKFVRILLMSTDSSGLFCAQKLINDCIMSSKVWLDVLATANLELRLRVSQVIELACAGNTAVVCEHLNMETTLHQSTIKNANILTLSQYSSTDEQKLALSLYTCSIRTLTYFIMVEAREFSNLRYRQNLLMPVANMAQVLATLNNWTVASSLDVSLNQSSRRAIVETTRMLHLAIKYRAGTARQFAKISVNLMTLVPHLDPANCDFTLCLDTLRRICDLDQTASSGEQVVAVEPMLNFVKYLLSHVTSGLAVRSQRMCAYLLILHTILTRIGRRAFDRLDLSCEEALALCDLFPQLLGVLADNVICELVVAGVTGSRKDRMNFMGRMLSAVESSHSCHNHIDQCRIVQVGLRIAIHVATRFEELKPIVRSRMFGIISDVVVPLCHELVVQQAAQAQDQMASSLMLVYTFISSDRVDDSLAKCVEGLSCLADIPINVESFSSNVSRVLTAATYRQPASWWASQFGRFWGMVPSLVEVIEACLHRNDVVATSASVGLLLVILRAAWDVKCSEFSRAMELGRCARCLLKSLRIRRDFNTPTQALACGVLIIRMANDPSVGIPNQAGIPTIDLVEGCVRLMIDMNNSLRRLLRTSDNRVLRDLPNVRRAGSDQTTDWMRRIAGENQEDDKALFIGAWAAPQGIEELLHVGNIGQTLAQDERLITSISSSLECPGLPHFIQLELLRLLWTFHATYRLHTIGTCGGIALEPLCTLVRSRASGVSEAALRIVWQQLRNCAQRTYFADAVLTSAVGCTNAAVSAPAQVPIVEAFRFIKDVTYSGELEPPAMEAALGALAQLAKLPGLTGAIIEMHDLPPTGIFLDDPYNLLSALVPATTVEVALQQCKLIQHLCAHAEGWRRVVEKQSTMDCIRGLFRWKGVASRKCLASTLELVVCRLDTHQGQSAYDNVRQLVASADMFAARQIEAVLIECLPKLEGKDSLSWLPIVGSLTCVLDILTSKTNGIDHDYTEHVATRLPTFPQTLARVVAQLRIDDSKPALARQSTTSCMGLLRILRRLSEFPSVALGFLTHSIVDRSEPFDLLFLQIHPLKVASYQQSDLVSPESWVAEPLRIALNLARNSDFCKCLLSRVDILDIVFYYLRRESPRSLLELVWSLVLNIVIQSVHVVEIIERLAEANRMAVFEKHFVWDLSTRELAAIISKTLKLICEKSELVHRLVYAVILENIALIVSYIASSCSGNYDDFTAVLALSEQIINVCELRAEVTPGDGSEKLGSVAWSNGIRVAVERLMCSLCDLLLFFHEDERRRSLLPGYELVVTFTEDPCRHESSIHPPRSKRNPHLPKSPSAGVVTRKSFRIRSKRTGVYCNGYSPPSLDTLHQILRVFSSACTFRVMDRTRRNQEQRSIAACGNCIVYITDFFFNVAQTPSGRFFLLNPPVIGFWLKLIPGMNKHSRYRLCESLTAALLAKDQTLAFLTSGGLKLLVMATCSNLRTTSIKRISDRRRRSAGSNSRRPVESASFFHESFLQFTIAIAILSERPQFLQSTYYLVHAGSQNSIQVVGVMLAAIIHTDGNTSYARLACTILARLLSMFTLNEARECLSSIPKQVARALGWEISEEDVASALLTMLHVTERESIMKIDVVVKVIHDMLHRTAVLGLIDKGIPQVLHDFGLTRMHTQMRTLVHRCDQFLGLSRGSSGTVVRRLSTGPPAPSSGVQLQPATGNDRSLFFKEKWAAGLTAVGGAAIQVGANFLLANAFMESPSEAAAGVEDCVQSLKELTNEVAEYAIVNYKEVFRYFESMNDDLELIAAMESASHAIAFKQAAFYALSVFEEAILAALQDYDSPANESVKVKVAMDCDTYRRTVTNFFEPLEQLLEWIAISLQHNDTDILFFGHKLHKLELLVAELLTLPLLVDDPTSYPAENGSYRTLRGAADSGDADWRIRGQRASKNRKLFVRFCSLDLRSWIWSVLGFLPYLRVQHLDDVQLVRFRRVDGKDESITPGLLRYECKFEVADSVSHIETSYMDLPHSMTVEIWIYIPFWCRDILISQSQVPLLARSAEVDEFEYQFYPRGSRGARAYRPEALGVLYMSMTEQHLSSPNDPTDLVATRQEYPAYSTLGSRRMRRSLRNVIDSVLGVVHWMWNIVFVVLWVRKMVEVAGTHRRRAAVNREAPSQQKSDHMNASLEDMTRELMTKILGELTDAIHPDKLLGSSDKRQANEALMGRLWANSSAFSNVLAEAFQSKNRRIWSDLDRAVNVIKQVFLAKGRMLFTSMPTTKERRDHHHHGQRRASAERDRDHEQRVRGSFFNDWDVTATPHQQTFREVSSQLRFACIFRDAALNSGSRLDSNAKTGGSVLLSTPPSMILQSIKRGSLLSTRVSDRELYRPSLPATHHIATSRSEWRMVSPHVSLWNLSQQRLPEWHSFARMVAPTTLNHFLIQPIERLQVYCISLRFLDVVAKRHESRRLEKASTFGDSNAVVGLPSHRSVTSSNDILDLPIATNSTTVMKSPTFPNRATLLVATPPKYLLPLHFLRRGAAVVRSAFALFTGQANLARVQNRLLSAPAIEDFRQLEVIRGHRLLAYHHVDPFDAASRLKRLYHDVRRLPMVLYREGAVATLVNTLISVLLIVTIWRMAIARDSVRDSAHSFRELYEVQSNGDDVSELIWTARGTQGRGGRMERGPRIVITDQQQWSGGGAKPGTSVGRSSRNKLQVAPSAAAVSGLSVTPLPVEGRDYILLTERELRHLVTILEFRNLISDVCRIWPIENGNIGLGGFWSSLVYSVVMFATPPFFLYVLFPWLLARSASNVHILSNIASAYGFFWIVMALASIISVTHSIPAFRDVRRVDKINLTEFPYCIRNYMAIGSVIWEGFQLNTTSLSVWKMSYKPRQLAALTTIDLQDIGLGFIEVNLFQSKQVLGLVSLVVWFFCLKASNKFKSVQWLNYFLTFLLPNFLGGMLFMFLSKQYYASTACFTNAAEETVLWSNSALRCWTPEHSTYALRGMYGMSGFVPLAVLAYGSYQVFFPEVNLDVQTSPLLNVNAQIVKATMMGALTFFVNNVRLFLGVALVGNLLLLGLVVRYHVCSSWHLKYAKVFIYSISAWSAACAMVSTFFTVEEREELPMDMMHTGWGVIVAVALLATRWKTRSLKKDTNAMAGPMHLTAVLPAAPMGSVPIARGTAWPVDHPSTPKKGRSSRDNGRSVG